MKTEQKEKDFVFLRKMTVPCDRCNTPREHYIYKKKDEIKFECRECYLEEIHASIPTPIFNGRIIAPKKTLSLFFEEVEKSDLVTKNKLAKIFPSIKYYLEGNYHERS